MLSTSRIKHSICVSNEFAFYCIFIQILSNFYRMRMKCVAGRRFVYILSFINIPRSIAHLSYFTLTLSFAKNIWLLLRMLVLLVNV